MEIVCAVKESLALLFAEAGSVVSLPIVAVLVIVDEGGTEESMVTPMVIEPLAAAARELMEQLTVPFAPTAGVVHVHPAAEIVLKSTPGGRTSVIVAFAALLGPLFV